MNGHAKQVVSGTLDQLLWNNSALLKGDLAQEVRRLKEAPGQDILVAGSATLVRELLNLDLVDELRLIVFPVLLGGGKRLFGEGTGPKTLKLVEAKPMGPAGVVVLVYHPDAP